MFLYITYLVMFLVLTTISIYLRIMHRGNRLVHWASLLILCGGLLGLQLLLERGWIPFAMDQGIGAANIELWLVVASFLNVVINTFPYCCVLIFYLIYNGYFNHQRWVPIVVCLPMWITLFQTNLLENRMNSQFIGAWGFIYFILILWLAVRSIAQGNNRGERLNHLLIALIFVIPIGVVNIYQFSNNAVSDHLIQVIPYMCFISLLIISLLYVRDAFLGVKRKSIQTINVGTGVIHHSLKNSIGKIKLNALNIRKSLQLGQYQEAETYIDQLLKTHEAMMESMSQISHAISDKVSLQREKVNIAEVLDEVLASIEEAHPNVRITKQYAPTILKIDRRLITEALQNICNNAVEAMKEKGDLRVQLVAGTRRVHLSISDTGVGMDNIQIQNVFEPFYSTKHRSGKHFGLGMYHVKKVMALHQGKVELKSAPNKGTTIHLIFKNEINKDG